MASDAKWSYDLVIRRNGDTGRIQHYAVSACATDGCAEKFEHRLGGLHNPEWVQKAARQRGWKFDSWRKGRNICPTCAKSQAANAKGESGKKVKPPDITECNAEPAIIIDPPYSYIPMEPALNDTTPTGANNGTPRALTVDERLAVRKLLDSYFDEAIGAYIEDYSDHRIGAECKVPRAAVTALREFAYGALKSHPELDGAQATLNVVEGKLKAAERTLEAAKAGAEAAKDVADKALARVDEATATVQAIRDSIENARRQIQGIAAKLGIAA